VRAPFASIRIGTRGSALARLQTEIVADALRSAWSDLITSVVVIATRGDAVLDKPLPEIGGKGLFTAELEAALRDATIDLAIHSLKDLPGDSSPGLILGAVLPRADERDALVSRHGHTLASLPHGATVGTSSLRRAAQLRAPRPDLRIKDLRGNIDTRLRKALDPDGAYDAVVVAAAALARLGRTADASELVALDVLMPAPGQGALAVQCRDEARSRELLAPLHDPATAAVTAAERAFLEGLGGGCAVPIAAHGRLDTRGLLVLHGRVCSLDGSQTIDVKGEADVLHTGSVSEDRAHALGLRTAQSAIERGVGAILGGA
jgi:hydroxymethylbilane synthase